MLWFLNISSGSSLGVSDVRPLECVQTGEWGKHVYFGSLFWGKNWTDQWTSWHVSNLGLWGWLRKLGVSSGRSPWWWLRISKQLVEVQNDGRKVCVSVTSFPVKPMKLNEGWIWVKKPHKCSFFTGLSSTQSTEAVRGSVFWTKLSWQVIQKKNMSSAKNEKDRDEQGAWQESRAWSPITRSEKGGKGTALLWENSHIDFQIQQFAN